MTAPTVDLSSFSIRAPYAVLPGEPGHETRARIICSAVGASLGLPAGIALDSHQNYATLAFCSGSFAEKPVEIRARVLGFTFGKGAKKDKEYLALSFVALDKGGVVVGWSEDIRFVGDGHREWAAQEAGLPPPPPKSNPRDCAKLSFVAGDVVTPITPALRALVAKVAPATAAKKVEPKAAAKKPAAKKPAAKKPAKKK
jgi:hypothetical protein